MRRASVAFFLAVLSLAGARAQNCANTSVGLTPINDLGAGTYQGFSGGLYAGGSNVRPLGHEVAGLEQASHVQPRDAAGTIDFANGKIAFISIGMSNCVAHFQTFMGVANADAAKSPRVA